MIRVAVAGAGAWGINHVRAFARQKGAELRLVCDESQAALAKAAALAPSAATTARLDDALGSSEIDAVVLATPAVHHAAQARAALEAGKHVLVEKPMALSGKDAETVVAAARRAGKTLMVGHLMLYHPAMAMLKKLVDSGDLGQVFYLYALRVNLGRLRRDENAMWSLAPHDISMILHLVGEEPESVSVRGGSYLQSGIEDVCFINLRFKSGVIAQIQNSWIDPRKERRLTIVGSKKMVEFDDVHPVEKIRIYDKGFDRPATFTEYGEYLSIRHGDIHIPHVPMVEPLETECRHFIDCVGSGKTPITNGASALQVVRVLDAASRSLAQDGAPVTV